MLENDKKGLNNVSKYIKNLHGTDTALVTQYFFDDKYFKVACIKFHIKVIYASFTDERQSNSCLLFYQRNERDYNFSKHLIFVLAVTRDF